MPQPNPLPSKPEEATSPRPTRGGDVGANLLACVVVGGLLGYGIDVWLQSLPIGLIAGIILGFAAWLRVLWKMVNVNN